jgi:hypothetical protein
VKEGRKRKDGDGRTEGRKEETRMEGITDGRAVKFEVKEGMQGRGGGGGG